MSPSSTTPNALPSRAARTWGRGALAVLVAGAALQAAPAAHAVEAPMVTGPQGTVTEGVEITWTAVDGATQYELQVDDDPAFSTPEWRSTGVGTVSVPTSPLGSGEQYVRVRAKQGNTWSDWGQSVFNVGPVAGPDLVAPAAGAELKQPGEPPLLRWSPVGGATSYAVEIDTDDDFIGAKAYTSRSTSLVVPDNQAPGRTYHWRVRATLATNILSNVSDSRTYTVLPLDTPEMDTLYSVDITDVVLDWEPGPRGQALRARGRRRLRLQQPGDRDQAPEGGRHALLAVGHLRQRPVLLARARARRRRQPHRVDAPAGR